ncbi:MAG: hypothetical protein HOY44_00165 [Maritimibacter sp.]|uniref:hypothetical protein n=1 Tax=Maritimibacter sp. TaxID=2003363 RepID=UPI001D826F7E|nr:hypothetical protein [Maritimibacter sp.]MBL6425917.1 hypothetical protein [Maritimibacter sp.]
MKRPNPINANLLSPAERRTELCDLLALGLVRLQLANGTQLSDANGESSLHSPPDQCRHATPTHEEKT